MNTKICHAEGCVGKRHAKNLCKKHYSMWKRYGDALTPPKQTKGAALKWIEDHKNYDGGGCLIWPFGSHGSAQFAYKGDVPGYGQSVMDGKRIGAHVHMAIVAHGDFRDAGMIVAHSCGKGHEGCCHPRHVRWSTHKDNTADMRSHGTLSCGERHPVSKLTDAEVSLIREMEGKTSHRSLAKMFNVSHGTIQRVLSRESWKHVA